MRIVHIITSLDDGGAEASLFRLVQAEKSSCHYVVSLSGEGKYAEFFRRHGVSVSTLKLRLNFFLPFRLIGLVRTLRILKPDVVQTWMYHADFLGGLAARCAGLQCIVWSIHHSDTASSLKWSTRLVLKMNAFMSTWLPASIIVCAQSTYEQHFNAGFDETKMIVVPNGVDLRQFMPRPESCRSVRTALGLSDDIFLFAMIGRFHPVKDHLNLLSALGQVPHLKAQWHCLLAGSGVVGGNERLAGWIQEFELDGCTTLLGQRDDIERILNAVDVLVLPSKSEAFPNVILEAMSSGVPCIATDVGDAALMIGETGWIVSKSDPEALALACLEAIRARSEKDVWNARCVDARARVANHFTLEHMVDGYVAVWSAACLR